MSDKLSDALFVIAFGNLQPFHPLPELKHRVVIVDGKFPRKDLVAHKSLSHVERSRDIPQSYHKLRYGIESLTSRTTSAALQPRLRLE
jgi:hypothetical protein